MIENEELTEVWKRKPRSSAHAMACKEITESVSYGHAFRTARLREEFKAQHGPVKVLVKDGKPVQNG